MNRAKIRMWFERPPELLVLKPNPHCEVLKRWEQVDYGVSRQGPWKEIKTR